MKRLSALVAFAAAFAACSPDAPPTAPEAVPLAAAKRPSDAIARR